MKSATAYFRLNWIRNSSYIWDFVAQNVNSVVNASIGLGLIILLKQNNALITANNYQFILVVYIMYAIAVGFFYQIFMGYLLMPEYVISGDIDVLLLRPEGLAKTLIKKDFNLQELLRIVVGYGILFTLIPSTFKNVIVALLVPISGAMIMGGLAGILSSLTFKYPSTGAVMLFVFPISNMGQYPMDAYPKWIRLILTIIPIAFISYYPSSYLVKYSNASALIGSIMVGIAMFALSVVVIQRMAKSYCGPNT